MTKFDSVSNSLDLLVHSYDDVPGDWQDVLARAGSPVERRRRVLLPRRRLAIACGCLLVAAAIVATAFATGFADRFSSWLTGKPGTPAPASEQTAFARRNAAAYASFPQGTELRLLLSTKVGGRTFHLLGFQNGDAYCLRLIRADRAGGIGENACLRAAELDGTSAVVAGDPRFSVGDPAKTIDGVYGFVADNVRAILVSRLRTTQVRALLANNVFLSLRARPAGSVQHHPAADPVTTVTAAMKAGGTKPIPYLSEGWGAYPSAHVSVPSYFGRSTPPMLGGPTKVAYRASNAISWLEQHEPRGAPFPKNTRIGRNGTIEFGRIIQPDPASPVRVGVVLFDFGAGSGPGPRFAGPKGTLACLVRFGVLATQPQGMSCNTQPASSRGPVALGSYLGSAITDLTGLASDAVASIRIYLADGRTVEAALRDNVFSVAVPAAELPGKLVALDSHGRAIAIQEVGGASGSVVRTCPAATLTRPTSTLPAAQPWEKIDLADLHVNGRPILGQTVAAVTAALGRPTHMRGSAQITNGVAIPALLYGGTTSNNAELVIDFIKKGSKIVANGLSYSSPSLTDARIGNLLRLQPSELQARVRSTYGSAYRLRLAYGSNPGAGCTGTFVSSSGPRGFRFGLNPYRPSRPYLAIMANAAAAG
jgi:hypothetical protein